MRAAVRVSNVIAADVRIDLGGGDAGMTEHGLHTAQIGTTSEQVSRK
jgi:hypothetical protein